MSKNDNIIGWVLYEILWLLQDVRPLKRIQIILIEPGPNPKFQWRLKYKSDCFKYLSKFTFCPYKFRGCYIKCDKYNIVYNVKLWALNDSAMVKLIVSEIATILGSELQSRWSHKFTNLIMCNTWWIRVDSSYPQTSNI